MKYNTDYDELHVESFMCCDAIIVNDENSIPTTTNFTTIEWYKINMACFLQSRAMFKNGGSFIAQWRRTTHCLPVTNAVIFYSQEVDDCGRGFLLDFFGMDKREQTRLLFILFSF